MANNAGKTLATLIVGVAVGAAAGYVLGTDKDKRQAQIDKIKDSLDKLKAKLNKKSSDIEEEIFSA